MEYRFLLLLLLSGCPISFCALLTYSESCGNSSGTTCDDSKFLTCFQNRCVCQNQEDMIFDPELNTCVTKLFKRCEVRKIWHHENQPNTDKPDYVSRKTPCVRTAICDRTTNVCRCYLDRSEYSKRTKELGHPDKRAEQLISTCHSNNKCPENSGLLCINGFCQCYGKGALYFNGSRCVSREDGPCDTSADCTRFAECVKPKGLQKRCKCTKGYYSNKKGLCLGQYGTSCNVNEPCLGDLHCVDGICKCGSKLEIYDEAMKSCKGLVGATCKDPVLEPCFEGDDHLCVKHATCSSSNYYGTCQCRENKYPENENRKCGKN